MKKYRLKKWVALALVYINAVLALTCAVIEWGSLLAEVYVKGFSIAIIVINTYLLVKYGDLEDRKDM